MKFKSLTFVLLLLAGATMVRWIMSCPKEITQSLGQFETREAAEVASIKTLEAKIQKCPEATDYRIIWTVVGVNLRQSTLYRRRKSGKGWIGYEADAYSGFAEDAYAVEDSDIKTVAERDGTLMDFRQIAKERQEK